MIIAGTGHRPQFCPCGFDENHIWLTRLKYKLAFKLGVKNPTAIVSGMAIGYDTWLAEMAIDLGIPLHAYVPFMGQGSNWPEAARKKYQYLLDNATNVRYISEDYSKDAFLKRDRAMIDDCDEVFSLLDPTKTSGGTYYTVKYAKQNNKVVTNLW